MGGWKDGWSWGGDGDGLLCGNVLGYIHNPKTRPFDGGGFFTHNVKYDSHYSCLPLP